jgi:hypothetical protein
VDTFYAEFLGVAESAELRLSIQMKRLQFTRRKLLVAPEESKGDLLALAKELASELKNAQCNVLDPYEVLLYHQNVTLGKL